MTYPTPAAISPDVAVFTVRVPNNPEARCVLRGLLYLLWEEWFWEQEPGGVTAEEWAVAIRRAMGSPIDFEVENGP